MPQKKRTSKTSSRERKSSRRVQLTGLQKALLGGGIVRSYRPLTKQESDGHARAAKAAS